MTPEPATPDDIPALRALHLANWREAYGAFLPEESLGAPAEAYMDARWTPGAMAQRAIWLCRRGLEPLGFIALEREASGAVFVDNLHVAPKARGTGLGRRLMRVAAETGGAAGVWLLVMDANAHARAVYRTWGGTEGAPVDTSFLGTTVQDRRVDWTSGNALAHALRAAR